jgi:hypothetical protein
MLVKKRGELKGLSHKEELAQTKEQINVSFIYKRVYFIDFQNVAKMKI